MTTGRNGLQRTATETVVWRAIPLSVARSVATLSTCERARAGAPVRRDHAVRNWRSEARAKEHGMEPPPANGAGIARAEGGGHENTVAFS